jgi:hypothetical protein
MLNVTPLGPVASNIFFLITLIAAKVLSLGELLETLKEPVSVLHDASVPALEGAPELVDGALVRARRKHGQSARQSLHTEGLLLVTILEVIYYWSNVN